jgi:hypothetical protein
MTKNYTATVLFTKEAEKDHYERGCEGGSYTVCQENIQVNFTSTEDLKVNLAEWASSRFDIDKGTFLEHVHNECENHRFDYDQSEDWQGDAIKITPENPHGYLARYEFLIMNVVEVQEVDFTF